MAEYSQPDVSERMQALTITYAKHQGNCPKFQFDNTIKKVMLCLRRMCIDFELYAEFTTNGRIHYHVLCGSKKSYAKYQSGLAYLRKNCGFCINKDCRDPEGWREYCLKHNADMEELIGVKFPLTQSDQMVDWFTNDQIASEVHRKVWLTQMNHTIDGEHAKQMFKLLKHKPKNVRESIMKDFALKLWDTDPDSTIGILKYLEK